MFSGSLKVRSVVFVVGFALAVCASTAFAAVPIQPFPPAVSSAVPIQPFPPAVSSAVPIQPFPPAAGSDTV